MFHLAAYFESIDNTANVDINAAVDDIIAIQNNHLILPQDMWLLAVAAMSATITNARLASPSMRQIANPFIRPLIAAAVPGSNPNVMILDHNPFRLTKGEELQITATSAVAMGSEDFTAFLWLADGKSPLPQGNVTPLQFTSTTACVADTWTSVALTWNDSLPSGRYAAVMSEHWSATGRGHRWIFSNQIYRPGYLSFTANSGRHPYAMGLGQFGLMGTFLSTDLPRLQVLAGTTDNAHTGNLYVTRLGPLP